MEEDTYGYFIEIDEKYMNVEIPNEDFDLTLKEEEIELIDEINMQNENKKKNFYRILMIIGQICIYSSCAYIIVI
jgi:hypothetical protein